MRQRQLFITRMILASLMLMIPCLVNAAFITVDSLGDTGSAPGACELRSAIEAANTDAVVDSCVSGLGPDTIIFRVNGVIVLSRDLPDVVESLIVDGTGTTDLQIDGDGLYRQFRFNNASGDHEIRNLGLSKGYSAGQGGCVYTEAASLTIEEVVLNKCASDSTGGALLAIGDVSIVSSYFENNRAQSNGGAIFFSTGTYTIFDSTFASNASEGANSDGGAISLSGGSVNSLRNTFHDNHSDRQGGAIYGFGSMRITSSTISGNQSNDDGIDSGFGGGIYFFNGDLSLANSIIAENTDLSGISRPDVAAGLNLNLTSYGFNLVGDNSGAIVDLPAGSPNVSGDWVGTAGTPLLPGLEALGDFGGPTPTMPPRIGGFVVDKGGCGAEKTDQRGFFNAGTGFRIVDNAPANIADGCDIGSTELEPYIDDILLDGFE